MDAKKLNNYKKRIVKANQSLSAFGDMILTYEIDAMPENEKLELFNFLASKSIAYTYLSKKLNK